jgi:hypothetical protein
MGVSVTRQIVCWALLATVPPPLLGQAPSAILHAQGGVWVNGYEARDSSAVFAGDLLETKPSSSATLTLEGSSLLLQPEAVAKFQADMLVLDHGSVSVGTSTRFKVQVNCITVVPVLNEWTQYDVTNVNGTIQVAARKQDVNVEIALNRRRGSPEPEASYGAIVREGEQHSYDQSEVCGAPSQPTGAGTAVSPKWIAAGAGGAGILIWILVHGGGGKSPVSPTIP